MKLIPEDWHYSLLAAIEVQHNYSYSLLFHLFETATMSEHYSDLGNAVCHYRCLSIELILDEDTAVGF